MPAISGSFSGKVRLQAAVAVPDQSGHEMSLAEVNGVQKSRDKNWNKAAVSYWGVTDAIGGKGSQTGYFVNVHGDGDRDWGTFEGKVAAGGAGVTVEGAWQFTGGNGRFKGLTGGGLFKTAMGSDGKVDATWQGTYQLAPAKK